MGQTAPEGGNPPWRGVRAGADPPLEGSNLSADKADHHIDTTNNAESHTTDSEFDDTETNTSDQDTSFAKIRGVLSCATHNTR
jgi:hypothetical protein